MTVTTITPPEHTNIPPALRAQADPNTLHLSYEQVEALGRDLDEVRGGALTGGDGPLLVAAEHAGDSAEVGDDDLVGQSHATLPRHDLGGARPPAPRRWGPGAGGRASGRAGGRTPARQALSRPWSVSRLWKVGMGSEQRSAPARLGRMLKLIDALSERLCDAYTAWVRSGFQRSIG